MVEHLIYGLVDPRTAEIRYVGKSSRGLRRPEQHGGTQLAKDATHKGNWIRRLQSLGLAYEVVVLERVSDATLLDESERRWISIGRGALGPRFTNQADGGEGGCTRRGFHHSAETIRKMSAAKKGKAHPQLRRGGATGTTHSASTRARQSRAAFDRLRNGMSDETRRRMSVAAKARCAALTAEARSQKAAHMRAGKVQ
jgi:hypothetical protein